MTGRFLLDTNIVIGIFNGDALLRRRLINTPEIFLNIIVLGELLYGAHNSGRVAENVAQVERFASAMPVLSCDSETAHHYGVLKTQLRKQGKPIPENDLWIAALANQHDMVLVSRDPHFSALEDLRREIW